MMRTRDLTLLGVAVAACVVLVIGLRGVIPQVSGLYPLTLPPNPYFVPEHALLLYVATPLVVLASIGLLLAPGVLLVLVTGSAERFPDLILKGFGAAFLWYITVTSGLKLLWGPLTASGVLAATVMTCVLVWAFLVFRVNRGGQMPWPLARRTDRRRLLWLVGIVALLTIALLPVLFWQDFNSDGYEELQFGRSLIENILPLNLRQLIITGAEGRVNVPYNISWFILLFGPIEGAVHLPFFLDVVLLFSGLLALIEWRAPRELRPKEEAVLVLALAVFTVTVCYSAAYSPYFADLNVAASETLPVACMVAAAYFLWAGRLPWAVFYASMAHFGRPTGLMFLVMLGIGFIFAGSREDLIPNLKRVGATIVLCMAAMLAYQIVLVPWVSGWTQAPALGGGNAHRLAYLRLDDYQRFLWVLVPGGILPAVSLLAFRWQDPVGRSLTVVTALYFLFFYIIAFVALHHFLPVMVLPLIVFWRLVVHRPYRRWVVAAAAAAATGAFWLSLPNSFEVNRTIRSLAQTVHYRIDDEQALAASRHPRSVGEELLFPLFPAEWSMANASEELVIMSGPLIYYSKLLHSPIPEVNYVIQMDSDPPPLDFLKVVDDGFGAAYVRDTERWADDRRSAPRTDYRSPIYDVPRETLFRSVGRAAGNYTIDLAAIACRPPLRNWAGPDLCTRAGY